MYGVFFLHMLELCENDRERIPVQLIEVRYTFYIVQPGEFGACDIGLDRQC